MAALCVAWLMLGRRLPSTRALIAIAVLWTLPLALAPPLFSRDVYSYIAQSRLLPHGVNPYLYGTGVFDTYFTDGADWMWKTSPAPYGPFWMGLSTGVYQTTHAQPIAAPARTAFPAGFRRALAGGLIYLVAIAVAFVSPAASFAIDAVIALYFAVSKSEVPGLIARSARPGDPG